MIDLLGILAMAVIILGILAAMIENGCKERMRTTQAIIDRKRAAREAVQAERDRVNSIPGFVARKLAQRKLRAQDKTRYMLRG